MTVSVHNPGQHMDSLRQIIAQGRKRIGLLVGAGAPAGIFPPGSDKPLISAVPGLHGFDRAQESRGAMQAITLDAGKSEVFARAALVLRYDEEKPAPITESQILMPRRTAGEGRTLLRYNVD